MYIMKRILRSIKSFLTNCLSWREAKSRTRSENKSKKQAGFKGFYFLIAVIKDHNQYLTISELVTQDAVGNVIQMLAGTSLWMFFRTSIEYNLLCKKLIPATSDNIPYVLIDIGFANMNANVPHEIGAMVKAFINDIPVPYGRACASFNQEVDEADIQKVPTPILEGFLDLAEKSEKYELCERFKKELDRRSNEPQEKK